MLTNKQQKTIIHCKRYRKLSKPMEIIEYCVEKISLPRKPRQRRYTKNHYQQIINYLAQGGKI